MGFDYDSLPAHMKEKVDKARLVQGRVQFPAKKDGINVKEAWAHVEKLSSSAIVSHPWSEENCFNAKQYPIAIAPAPKPPKMNLTEQRLEQHLANQKLAGEILWYKMHGFGIRLADNTFFYPDAMVMEKDRSISIYDAKGQNRKTGKGLWKDDAKVKIKIAAELYPIFRWRGISHSKKNGWVVEEYSR